MRRSQRFFSIPSILQPTQMTWFDMSSFFKTKNICILSNLKANISNNNNNNNNKIYLFRIELLAKTLFLHNCPDLASV